MVLFQKALLLVTNFRKKIKNKNKIKNKKFKFFYRIFIKKFQNFLKFSQQFVVYVQTREQLTLGFLNVVENRLR